MMTVHPYLTSLFMVIRIAGSAGIIPSCSFKDEVTAPVGGTAILSCPFLLYENFSENRKVVWEKKSEGLQDLTMYIQDPHDDWDNSDVYMGRTAIYNNWLQSKNTTLEVDRVRESDAGDYSCCIKWSRKGLKYIYKCCTIRLKVEQDWRGDQKLLIATFSMYFIFLFLCLYSLNRCGSQQ